MPNYVLRNIDPELWRQVKTRAASEGRSVRFVLIEFLKAYTRWGFHVVETFDGGTTKPGGGDHG